MADRTVHVVMQNGETGVVWEGEATSVSSTNSQGPFDILPQHANFITIIKNQPLHIVRPNKEKKTMQLTQAVLLVQDDTVSVYSVGPRKT